MTVRLYHEDAFCRTFTARAEAVRQSTAGWEVRLDRTCFYATSGGQPADGGTLAGLPVLDVFEDDSGIWHVLPQEPAGAEVTGEIDWARRLDHMQQHSGQHLLSQVALQQLGAQTVSFHLGVDVVTIDLDRPAISADEALALEDGTNRLVLADIPVRTYVVAPEDVARLNLRKLPTKGENIRIVEIEGIDLSPCGGTHVRATGQIGLVKIRRLERYKGGTRVEFLCGGRALRDYQWKHQVISDLARDLTIADRDVDAAVRRALDEVKESHREVDRLNGELLRHEAAALRAAAARDGAACIIAQIVPGRDAAEVKRLASLLAAEPGTVALLAALEPSARLFFARAADVQADMRALLRQVTQQFGGGGGGRPETAEGGGLPPERVAEALQWAAQQLA